jgi:single-stranded-DNA-specific exonuclease
MPYNWSIADACEIPKDFLELANYDTLLARLLMNRGVTNTSLASYFLDLNAIQEQSPFEIPEMYKAFLRVKKAILDKEKIVIFGDYDVDGTSSVALMYRCFKAIGISVGYYIPNRFSEGYGLNNDAIKTIKQEMQADLLITCDCGISNFNEVEFANSLELDVIITDHHSIPATPPNSIANCNPKTLAAEHPLHFLPGVGVAYKLASLILDEFLEKKDAEFFRNDLLDLVALGMVADLAPLLSENRYLTIKGLRVLAKTSKVGLKELLKISGVEIDPDAEHIGFGIGPRINAAGRLDNALDAVQLMISDDVQEAKELALQLDLSNKERQILCDEIFDSALKKIEEDPDILDNNVIVLADASWHHGVIGIVASRLLERFHLPVFLIAIEDEIAKSSVRCIDVQGLDLFAEMTEIQTKTNLFAKFGGHKMAAGFSVKTENLDSLIQEINKHFKNKLANKDLKKTIKIDAALASQELTENLVTRINKLAPFGLANPSPNFVIGPLEIKRIKALGQEQKHLKLFLAQASESRLFEAVIWNRAQEFLEKYKIGDQLVFVFQAKINDFMQMRSFQLDIKDWNSEENLDMDTLFARFRKKIEAKT